MPHGYGHGYKRLHAIEAELNDVRPTLAELIADHATQKTSHDAIETLIEEMYDDEEAKRDYLDFLHEADGVRFGDYTFASQGAVTILVAGVAAWARAGIRHFGSLAGNLTLVAPSTATIGAAKFGAWRVVVSDLGALTTQPANATTMQFDNAEDALLNLAAIAPTASTITAGYLVLQNGSGGDYTIGTTNTNAANMTWSFYYERGPRKQVTGLTAALGAATAVGGTDTHYATGTRDYQINGLAVAQDAAEADKAFDDADTIEENGFGAWLIVTNLAQSATYALAANGIAGAVSAMNYTTAALAQAAIDTIVDNLPSLFCPVSRLVIENNLAGTWTANTDDLDGTDGTSTFTDATVGTWGRLDTSGFDTHKINPPTIPALLAAAKPASGPATLASTENVGAFTDPAGTP